MKNLLVTLIGVGLLVSVLLVARERVTLRQELSVLHQTTYSLAQQVQALSVVLTAQNTRQEEVVARLATLAGDVGGVQELMRDHGGAGDLPAAVAPAGGVVVTRKNVPAGDVAAASAGATGLVTTAGPTGSGPQYTSDLRIWPNAVSRANSDEWIVQNHDSIRRMEPRLLVINFTSGGATARLRDQVRQLVSALRKSSQYHGYRSGTAPAFLEYQVFKVVNSRDIPLKQGSRVFDYGALFGERYARLWGVTDPDNPARKLRLDELVERGYVHEVVFFFDPIDQYQCFECVEMKPRYDAQFKRIGNTWCQAGNGGDGDQPWIGRSVRINALNAMRGVGCGFENLGHSFEGMANADAIPYFTRYFREYAMLDLQTRYGLPFNSFYAMPIGKPLINYPNRSTAVITWRGQDYRLTNYVAAGGNVHFPPNARMHYDQDNDQPVASTIEDWRCGSEPGGKDHVINYSARMMERYRKDAPDCMGAWLIYWRQNMPGLDNKSKDDAGKPMKNWWPFLFY